MKLKIINGTNNVGKELIEVSTEEVKIVVGFGEDCASAEITENINPVLEGLTVGQPCYDGIFILRNPENSNVLKFLLKEVPIYMEKKLKNNFDICSEFLRGEYFKNVIAMSDSKTIRIKDLEVTPFIVDTSNFNTQLISFRDSKGKTIVVSGDFRDYDGKYAKDRLINALNIIESADYLIVEGKYLNKSGPNYTSGKEVIKKLKNIMKLYNRVFVIQSETDMITTTNMYKAAQKTRKAFIENIFSCNLNSIANGSSPSPLNNGNVYAYVPLNFMNKNIEFKKAYINPFYINDATEKMKRDKYVININKDMLQDMQLLQNNGKLYKSCVIFAEYKDMIKNDSELEEFINILKKYEMDYYEFFTYGAVNRKILQNIALKLGVRNIIPINFEKNDENIQILENLRILNENQSLDV